MLRVLDGAVLVVSAVEGVQAQTRVPMRTLQRWRIPTLIFNRRVHALQQQLPALTRGEGVLETAFARYAEVRS